MKINLEALLGPFEKEFRYGDDKTVHGSRQLDVEIENGRVVGVWFRCRYLPFRQHKVSRQRAKELRDMYKSKPKPVKAIVFDGPPP